MNERYRLTRLFSRGGMAELYLGTAGGAEGFEKRVAIKRILPHLAEDPEVARMFVAEARLATFLNHQNIVQVFDVGRGPDGLFIVMELVDGWDLGVIIEQANRHRKLIPTPLAAFIASQAMAGLCYAYRQEHDGRRIIVAHRDLSPSNLLLSAEGEVKVADFGIARLEAFHKTEPGTFKGKVAYSAPEALQGQPVTAASDQFSLGVVLYEMLSGRHPFGQFESAIAYAEPIVSRPTPEIVEAPPALAEILTRAMSKSPADRFPSPDAFAKALAQFLASTGTPTTTTELAEFLRTLDLPSRASRLSSQDTLIRAGVAGSFSLQAVPSVLSQGSPPPASPPPAGETNLSPLGPSLYAEQSQEAHESWTPLGPTVDSQGQIHRSENARTAAPPLPHVELAQAPIELAAAPPQPKPCEPSEPSELPISFEDQFAKPRPRRRIGRLLLVLIAVAIAGLVISGGLSHRDGWLAELKRTSNRSKELLRAKGINVERALPTLEVESDPSGALVQIGEERLGTTPLFMENNFPPSEIEVRVSLHGYQPWKGVFLGGETAVVKAKLQRR